MSNLANDPHEDAEAIAAVFQCGVDVVLPEPDQLLIDLDSGEDEQIMYAMIAVLIGNGIEARVEKTTASLGGNSHAYVRIKWPRRINPVTRIALQACLGSDRKRELLSLLWIALKTGREPTLFFERRDEQIPTVERGISLDGVAWRP